MKRILLLLLTLTAGLAWSGNLVTSISPMRVMAGVPAELRLSWDGSGMPEFTEPPKVDGLRWYGSSSQQSTRIINGQYSYQNVRVYNFVAEKPGRYRVPSQVVRVGNRKIRSEEVSFTASEPKVQVKRGLDSNASQIPEETELSKALFADASTVGGGKSYYIGEEIPLEISLFWLDGLKIRPSWPTVVPDSKANLVFKDFRSVNTENPQFDRARQSSKKMDGSNFHIYHFFTAFRAISPGPLKLNVSFNVGIQDTSRSRARDSFFDDFFDSPFSSSRMTQHTIRAKVDELNILPLPPRKNDSKFLGLVGSWRISADLSKKEAPAGEAVTLTVRVSGDGTLETLKAPVLEFPGIRTYNPEVEKSKNGTSAVIKYILIPTDPGTCDIQFDLSSFNPSKKDYQDFPFREKLTVKPSNGFLKGTSVGPAVVDAAPSADVSPAAAPRKQRAPSGVLYLKKPPYHAVMTPFYRNTMVLCGLLIVIGMVFEFLMELAYLRKCRTANDPGFQRQESARRRKGKLLNKMKNSNPEELLQMTDEITSYINDSLNLPPGDGLEEDASAVEKTHPELAESLKTLSTASWSSSVIDVKLRDKLLKSLGKLVCFSLLTLPLLGFSAEMPDSSEKAMTAYDEGHFEQALAYYRSIEQKSSPSPEILYNIANCYFQEGRYALALANYTKALKLLPRDSDILENLNLTCRKLSLPERYLIESPADVVPYLRDSMRPDEWMVFVSCGVLLMLIAFGLRRHIPVLYSRIAVVMGLAVLILGVSALSSQFMSSHASGRAVVITRNATVRALPSPQASPLEMKLYPGETVSIEESRLDYVRIRSGSAEGWVKASDVEKL